MFMFMFKPRAEMRQPWGPRLPLTVSLFSPPPPLVQINSRQLYIKVKSQYGLVSFMNLMAGQKIVITKRLPNWPNPIRECFATQEFVLPKLEEGQVLIRVHYVSIDPVFRVWVSGAKSYIDKTQLNQTVPAFGIGFVVESRAKIRKGSFVTGMFEWANYTVKQAKQVFVIPSPAQPLHWHLSLLGPTGLTAFGAMAEQCDLKPGQVFAISSAASATGLYVVQLAKLRGLKVIGTAGTDGKCQLVKSLGADYCFNYRTTNLKQKLKEVAPGGIDFFFDNVGEDTLESFLPAMSAGGKVLLCGATATYGRWKERKGISNLPMAITKQLRFKGIVFYKEKEKLQSYAMQLLRLGVEGQIKSVEDIRTGLQQCVKGVEDMQSGSHTGKILIRLAENEATARL